MLSSFSTNERCSARGEHAHHAPQDRAHERAGGDRDRGRRVRARRRLRHVRSHAELFAADQRAADGEGELAAGAAGDVAEAVGETDLAAFAGRQFPLRQLFAITTAVAVTVVIISSLPLSRVAFAVIVAAAMAQAGLVLSYFAIRKGIRRIA